VNGRPVRIPDGLQSPALELEEEEIRLGVYVFERSVLYLQGHFPDARIGVVYIPSPLSSYALASDRVRIESYEGRGDVFESDLVRARSDEIASRIEAVAERHGFGFVDARDRIRRRSAEVLVHGPRDWKHLNEAGHRALAAAAVSLIEDLERGDSAPPAGGRAVRRARRPTDAGLARQGRPARSTAAVTP
jgi:hypothetical protein